MQLKKKFLRVFFQGSLVNMNTIHRIYDSLSKDSTGPHRIGTTLLIAVSTCFVSLVCALLLWILDNRRKKVIQEDNPPDPCRNENIRLIKRKKIFSFVF
jgi:hypothetical protein